MQVVQHVVKLQVGVVEAAVEDAAVEDAEQLHLVGVGVEVVEVGVRWRRMWWWRWWQLISIFYQLHQYPVCLYLLNSIFVINLIMTDMVLKY